MWTTIKAIIFFLISGIIFALIGLVPIALFCFAAIPLAIIGYIAYKGSISAGVLCVAVFFFELYHILNMFFSSVGFLLTIAHIFFIIFGIVLVVNLFRNLFG